MTVDIIVTIEESAITKFRGFCGLIDGVVDCVRASDSGAQPPQATNNASALCPVCDKPCNVVCVSECDNCNERVDMGRYGYAAQRTVA